MGGMFLPPHAGVIHQFVRESLAAGGKLFLGSDSHTRYGTFGCMGIGEGGTELARHALGSLYEVKRPPILAVHLTGRLRLGVGSMDVALALIGATFKNGFNKNKILEFVGDGILALSVDFRIGLDAMSTESAAYSSVWMTDEKVKEWLTVHGRAQDFKSMMPQDNALYDGLIEIDLSEVEPMIALPFHPSNVYKIRELNANETYLRDVLAGVEQDAKKRSGLTFTLQDKVQNGRLTVQSASIAGCVGGTYENIAAVADILDGFTNPANGIDLGVYPASQPVVLELMKNQVAQHLLQEGVVLRSCICGPCCGTVDVPANNTLTIRHITPNYYGREGSKVTEGQLSAVALMDARSIAATVRNGGQLTAATELDVHYHNAVYDYDTNFYKQTMYNGLGHPRTDVEPQQGPNIKDWPAFPELQQHLLLKVAARYHGSTTTDELCPSGEASSYRSNPERIASYTLLSKDKDYVAAAKVIRRPYAQQDAETRQIMDSVCCKLHCSQDSLSYGSLLISDKIGDGSSREQAASNQKVLGGWTDLSTEYSNKRYRSNCISWGLLPLLVAKIPALSKGDYVLLQDVRNKLLGGAEKLEGILLTTGETVEFSLGELTADERQTLVAGGMLNLYKNQLKE